MSERARRLAHLRDLEYRQAELETVCNANVLSIRSLLDLTMHDSVAQMDISKAVRILSETHTKHTEIIKLQRQIDTLRDELGVHA
jgi:hypothetical protein